MINLFKTIKDKRSAYIKNRFWESIQDAGEGSAIEISIKTLEHFDFRYFNKGEMSTPFGMFRYKLK